MCVPKSIESGRHAGPLDHQVADVHYPRLYRGRLTDSGVEVGSRLATNSASLLLVACLDTTARIGPYHRAWRNGCSTREFECLREASQFSVDEVTGCALYDRFVVMATR